MTPFLAGKTVLLTRPRRQSEETRPRLESLGAAVLIQPVQEIVPAAEIPADLFTPDSLAAVDRIIFSSSNGVDSFLGTLNALDSGGRKRRAILNRIPLAAVGPATARRLESAGLHPDVVPTPHSAEGLLAALAGEARCGRRFLSIRGDQGRKVLKEGLTALGGNVQEVCLYCTREIEKPDEEIVRLMENGVIDYTFVMSPATAAGVIRLFGKRLCRTAIVSISPQTSRALSEAGCPAAFEAANAALEDMIESLRR